MSFSPPTMPFSPPVVYPNTVTTQPASHSKGSFGPVFAVLGVILVLSAIACILGQLCARRCSPSKARGDHHPKPRGDHHPKHRGDRNFHSEEGDIESGFKKKIPKGKPSGHGESRGPKPAENGDIEFGFKKKTPKGKPSGHGESRGPKPAENGETRGETNNSENIEARASGR